MKKKSILIVNNNMNIGGVQKALVNLLNEIHDLFDVTVLLFYCSGPLLDKIPSDVKVISVSSPYKCFGVTKNDKVPFFTKLMRIFMASITRLLGRKVAVRFADLFQKNIVGYDVAVSFLHSPNEKMFYGGCNEFVINRVKADKKITFVHCDYEQINAASVYNEGIYSKFDNIATCSVGCKTKFLKVFPQFSNKVSVVSNCQDYDSIHKLSVNENCVSSFERSFTLFDNKNQRESSADFTADKPLNIITVSRFGKEKGILRAINAVRDIVKQNKNIRYYVVGTGIEISDAQKIINESGINDFVFLLGEKDNPYAYMKYADLLLIPSFAEAAPMVINESAFLGVPVLSTETSSSKEMIVDRKLGWVCENSESGITSGIRYILDNPNELFKAKQYIQSIHFSNDESINAFMELIN